jgi:dipeptidyl aminopeptidase/acylaminoacyl peptidase
MSGTFGLTVLLATAVFTGSVLAQDTMQARPRPSIDDFARNPDFTQVTVSPDGNYLAALVPKPGKPHQNQLVILDAGTAKPLRVLNSGPYQLISHYLWVGKSRLIGTVAIQLDGLDTPIPTGELYAINADGSRPANLFGFRARANTETGIGQKQRRDAAATVISTELADSGRVLIATRAFSSDRDGTDTGIETLDVITGSSRRIGVSPAHDADFVADHNGQVRVASASRDFLDTLLWTRPDNDAPWVLVNDTAKSGVNLVPIGFNRDNSKLYVQTSQGDAPDAIELMDMASGERSLVYQGQVADPIRLLPTADGKDYYAAIIAEGRQDIHYIDANSTEAQLNRDLAKQFPGRLVYLSSFSADGKRAIVHEQSDRNPGDYFLLDLNAHSAHHLLSTSLHIDPLQMRPMQPIALKARDGLALHGFITLPMGHAPFPLVVLVHGGPFGVSDPWAFDPEVQMFASHGYAVLQVNYRGSGGYGSRFISRGYKQWGLAMEDDLIDATRWSIQQGYADPARLCIYGASYGGYAALEAVVREPDLYRCAIGYAGVYDMRVQLEKSDIQDTNAGVSFMRQTMGDDPASLLMHSPLAGVDRIKADLLLIHGGKDQRVPFKNFREFTTALDNQHKAYETLVEPDEGHGFFVEAHRIGAYEKMIDFLDRHIGDRRTGSDQRTVSQPLTESR